MSFSPFLSLPVILKLNGLPKPPKTPQLPSRETLGDSTQLHFLPRLSCGQSSQSQPSALRFPNLNIPRWSFRKRAPVEANASGVRLWGRKGGVGGAGGEKTVDPSRTTCSPHLNEGLCVCCDADKHSCCRSLRIQVCGWGHQSWRYQSCWGHLLADPELPGSWENQVSTKQELRGGKYERTVSYQVYSK